MDRYTIEKIVEATTLQARSSSCLVCCWLDRAYQFQGGMMTYLPQEEICPISEQLLFSLYDAAKRGLPVPVGEVPPERRSSVALFCYRRSHLEGAALAVAATCDEEDLVDIGGPLGRTLFLKSRNFASPVKNESTNSLSALALSLVSMQRGREENEEEDAES
jgi:hypothetical protein